MSDTNDTRDEAMKEAVKRTPRVFSVEDLVGMAADDEDRFINARREMDRERNW
jgi:hypothetical protein